MRIALKALKIFTELSSSSQRTSKQLSHFWKTPAVCWLPVFVQVEGFLVFSFFLFFHRKLSVVAKLCDFPPLVWFYSPKYDRLWPMPAPETEVTNDYGVLERQKVDPTWHSWWDNTPFSICGQTSQQVFRIICRYFRMVRWDLGFPIPKFRSSAFLSLSSPSPSSRSMPRVARSLSVFSRVCRVVLLSHIARARFGMQMSADCKQLSAWAAGTARTIDNAAVCAPDIDHGGERARPSACFGVVNRSARAPSCSPPPSLPPGRIMLSDESFCDAKFWASVMGLGGGEWRGRVEVGSGKGQSVWCEEEREIRRRGCGDTYRCTRSTSEWKG